MTEPAELDDGIQAVAELGREGLLDHFHGVGGVILHREADGRTRGGLCAGIRGHDQDDVAEIRLAPVVVGQSAVIHHLQQQVEDFRMRLLDLVQQQHAMRLLGDRLGEQTALVETHVTGRCADQAGHGMPLHVLGHVEAHQLDTQRTRQLARHLCLAHTGGAGEQERADRLVRRLEPRTGQLDGGGQRVDGLVLAEHGELEVALQVAQQLLVGAGDMLGRNARDLGDDVLDLRDIDRFHPSVGRQQTLVGARFVDHVDGLVRHVPIIDVAGSQLGGGAQRLVGVFDFVVAFEAALEPAQDADGVLDRGLGDIHLLEAPRQRTILFEDAAKFLEGGRADAADLTGGKQRLEQVGRIHHAARGRAGADDGVDLVDEQDGVRPLAQLVEQRLEALFEIAPVLGAGQQRAQIQRIDDTFRQQVGHLAIDDTLGQAFGDCRLADARLAHQQGIVLATPRQDLRNALNLGFAPHQWIDASLARQLVEVGGIGIQRMAGAGGFAALLVLHVLVFRMIGVAGHAGNAMGDVVDHIDARHGLLLEQEYRLAFLLAEDSNQHVGPGHLALAGALHVEDGTLQDTLEAQRRLGFPLLVVGRNQRGGRVDELLEIMAQLVQVSPTGTQHTGRRLVVQQGEQQVLDGHELVTLGSGLLERQIEGDFELSVQHGLPPHAAGFSRPSRSHRVADAGMYGRTR